MPHLRYKLVRTIAASVAAFLWLVQTGFATPLEDAIESTFIQAIVKIDVSSNTPVFKDNVNICVSEGTGFLVSSSTVVTAEHVFRLDPACGERIILIKSKSRGLQRLANVVAAANDVAVLKVDTDFPPEMCFLGLSRDDVYATQAIRFGIPGGFSEPAGAIGVRIGPKASDFAPLVVVTPTAAEKGESGGPVIQELTVVGLTLARHNNYPAYSFMTQGSKIRELLLANSIRPAGHICNPVETKMWTTPAGIPGFVGSISLNARLVDPNSSFSTELSDVAKKSATSDITVRDVQTGTVVIEASPRTLEKSWETEAKVNSATAVVAQQLRQSIWSQYVANAEKEGKWKTYKTCQNPAFGLAGWASEETVHGTSGWRGGGYNQAAYCSELINSVVASRGLGNQPHVVGNVSSGEEQRRAGILNSVAQYNYHCSIKLHWSPIYNERADPICGLQ